MPTKKPRKRKKPPTVTIHMNATILAIDANFDPITQAPFDYREENIYPLFQERGFTIVRRQGESARRTEVAPQARMPNVVYLTGVGHGFPDSYTGDNLDPIFSVGHFSPEEAAGKIVHFLSCETAADLGPDFVAKGCRAYFGYSDNFTYPPNLAEVFFDCDSEIDRRQRRSVQCFGARGRHALVASALSRARVRRSKCEADSVICCSRLARLNKFGLCSSPLQKKEFPNV